MLSQGALHVDLMRLIDECLRCQTYASSLPTEHLENQDLPCALTI